MDRGIRQQHQLGDVGHPQRWWHDDAGANLATELQRTALGSVVAAFAPESSRHLDAAELDGVHGSAGGRWLAVDPYRLLRGQLAKRLHVPSAGGLADCSVRCASVEPADTGLHWRAHGLVRHLLVGAYRQCGLPPSAATTARSLGHRTPRGQSERLALVGSGGGRYQQQSLCRRSTRRRTVLLPESRAARSASGHSGTDCQPDIVDGRQGLDRHFGGR